MKRKRQMKYLWKKVGTLIITLLIVSFLSFFAFSVIPGDAAQSKLGTEATEEQVKALREEMGLDKPVLIRYGKWITQFLQGDFGESYSYSLPVKEIVLQKMPIMIALVLLSFFWILVLSIPIGIVSAQHENRLLDYIIRIGNQTVMAIPSFFIGMIITLIFGISLKWFMPGCYVPIEDSFFGFLSYLIAPSVAIALPKTAMAVKILRSAIVSQKDMDYVRTAYSRGNTKRQVLYRHMLRNAMIPTMTFWAMTLVDLIANSIIIEKVFSIPGLGTMLITSISNRDYPVVQFIIVFVATLVILINFLIDLLYAKVDPRVSIRK